MFWERDEGGEGYLKGKREKFEDELEGEGRSSIVNGKERASSNALCPESHPMG